MDESAELFELSPELEPLPLVSELELDLFDGSTLELALGPALLLKLFELLLELLFDLPFEFVFELLGSVFVFAPEVVPVLDFALGLALLLAANCVAELLACAEFEAEALSEAAALADAEAASVTAAAVPTAVLLADAELSEAVLLADADAEAALILAAAAAAPEDDAELLEVVSEAVLLADAEAEAVVAAAVVPEAMLLADAEVTSVVAVVPKEAAEVSEVVADDDADCEVSVLLAAVLAAALTLLTSEVAALVADCELVAVVDEADVAEAVVTLVLPTSEVVAGVVLVVEELEEEAVEAVSLDDTAWLDDATVTGVGISAGMTSSDVRFEAAEDVVELVVTAGAVVPDEVVVGIVVLFDCEAGAALLTSACVVEEVMMLGLRRACG